MVSVVVVCFVMRYGLVVTCTCYMRQYTGASMDGLRIRLCKCVMCENEFPDV